MDNRSFQSGAIATPPSAPTVPSSGYPTNGSPGTGTPATLPGEYWFHQIGEELRAIIVAAGLTPSNASLSQLLTAFRSTGVFSTPAQFDNSTKAATTAFVATASGSFGLWDSIATSRPLVVSDIGHAIWFSATCTMTMPTPSSLGLRLGAAVLFHATVGTVGTVAAGAGALINYETTGVSSFTVKQGQSMTLIAISSSTWQVVSSTAEMGRNIDFASTIGNSGSQKLPSGLIKKWATVTSSATPGAALAVTFATAFPNGCFGVTATGSTTNTGNAAAWADTPTTTGFNLHAALAGQSVFYEAIGY